MTWFTLSRIGLLYDIMGAVVLVSTAIMNWKGRLAEAQLFWKAEPETKSLIAMKFDSMFGIVLIVIGFAGQLLGSDQQWAGYFFDAGLTGPALGLLLVVPLYWLMRDMLLSWYFNRVGR